MDKPSNMVLAPCPFCGAALVLTEQEEWVHPWDDVCPADDVHISYRDDPRLSAWNRRAATQLSLEGEVGEMIEKLRAPVRSISYGVDAVEYDAAPPALQVEAAVLLQSLSADNARLRVSVEQAFRDGLAYAGNVRNPDPDIAWEHSRAKAALDTQGGGNG